MLRTILISAVTSALISIGTLSLAIPIAVNYAKAVAEAQVITIMGQFEQKLFSQIPNAGGSTTSTVPPDLGGLLGNFGIVGGILGTVIQQNQTPQKN